MTILKGGIVNETPAFWGRNWRVIVELGDGRRIGSQEEHAALDVSNLRVTFNIEKDIQMNIVRGEIKIYNLNPKTEREIVSNSTKVYLEAGYGNTTLYGEIFHGDVWQVNRDWENQLDNFVKIQAIKDAHGLVYGTALTTVKRGTNYRNCLAQIAQSANLEMGKVPENWGIDRQLSRGFSCFGATKDIINGIAKSTNSIINIENKQVNVIDIAQPYTGEAWEINYKTGLIGRPVQTKEGIKVKTLINPSIKPNDWLHLNNEDIIAAEIELGEMTQQLLDTDGLYRVIRQNFTGDTRGNDWYVEHECVSQAGGLPDMMINSGQVAI